jgi:putative thioredoxin
MLQPILDVNEINITQILESSLQKPVLFYFWSPSQAECEPMTATIERIAMQHSQYLTIAKVDCDAEIHIASQFGLPSIPAVYLIDKGKPVDALVGALPEEKLLSFIAPVLPDETARLQQQIQTLVAENKFAEALPLAREVWQSNQQNSDSTMTLVEILLQMNRGEEVDALLNTIPIQDQDSRYQELVAKSLLQKQAADSPEIRQLEDQYAADSGNHALACTLAVQYHQAGRNEEALALLFKILQKDLNANEGKVREAFQEILTALGTQETLANNYRRKLFSLLY